MSNKFEEALRDWNMTFKPQCAVKHPDQIKSKDAIDQALKLAALVQDRLPEFMEVTECSILKEFEEYIEAQGMLDMGYSLNKYWPNAPERRAHDELFINVTIQCMWLTYRDCAKAANSRGLIKEILEVLKDELLD